MSGQNSIPYAGQKPVAAESEKVIFIIQRLAKGGAENFAISLINDLLEQGIHPIVILLNKYNPIINELEPSIKTYTLSRNFKYDISISKKVKQIILKESVRKVFCVGGFAFFLSKLLVLQNRDLKFYLSLHSTVPSSFKEFLLEMLYLRFVKRNDKIIFICKNQKEFYSKRYFFNPPNSTVIYNGINTNFYSSLSHDEIVLAGNGIKHSYNIHLKEKVILKVANLRHEKGHFYAVDALKILHDHYKEKAHLLFVGGGSEAYKNKIQDYINENNLISYIHLVGERKDVRPYLAAANVFTLTSFSVETFSIAALEAMSFGLPCCLTDIGGASELVEQNKNGLLCKAKDAFSIATAWYKLLNKNFDREYIKQIVRAKYNSTVMTKKYLNELRTD